jgi:Erythromycin biosynthesis protein CIII-like, C-terminal domain
VVAAGALQFAIRSVTEVLEIPYVFSAYCPAVLPSPDHPPAKMAAHHPQSLPPNENVALWEDEERTWHELFRETRDEERAKLGLHAIDSIQRHLLTDRPWLAAVVHHGDAGTTTVATGAGVPQIIVPHLYDQYYWAHRVQELGIGEAGPMRDALDVDGIISVLEDCMKPEIRDRAGSVARRIERCGTRIAAEQLVKAHA